MFIILICLFLHLQYTLYCVNDIVEEFADSQADAYRRSTLNPYQRCHQIFPNPLISSRVRQPIGKGKHDSMFQLPSELKMEDDSAEKADNV